MVIGLQKFYCCCSYGLCVEDICIRAVEVQLRLNSLKNGNTTICSFLFESSHAKSRQNLETSVVNKLEPYH